MAENSKTEEPFKINLTFFIALFFLMAWLGLFPSAVVAYLYFSTFPFSFDFLYLLALIPLFLVLYGIALLSSLSFTRLGFWVVHKRVAAPQLGTYRLSLAEPQFRAYILKGNVKGIGRWLYHFFHVPALRAFWMRRMGVKIGKNVKLGRYLEDEDFIEFGDNTFMANTAGFSGHMEDREYFVLVKTIVGKDCLFEPFSGAVGATVGDKSVFKYLTGAMKGMVCRGNAIYQGIPCKKVGNYTDLSSAEIESIKQRILQIDSIDYIKRKNAPIKINEAKLFALKLLIILGGCLLAAIFPYLYSIVFQKFYSPNNQFLTFVLLIPIPFLFLVAMGFFVFGTTLVIKALLIYYDRKVEIPEGYYDLDDPRAKIFKLKYLLRLFGLRIFRGTPFKIADTFAISFWGNVKIGDNIVLEDAIIDPEYLEVGDNVMMGAGARIHTHDIIDGKLYIKRVKIGKNVVIGGCSHIKPGVEIVEGSVIAAAAWLRKNLKTKRPALWLGKPAVALPLEMLTRTAGLTKKVVDG